MGMLTSKEVLDKVSDSAINKAGSGVIKLFILGILAGVFIAFGAQASQMGSFNLLADPDTMGMGRFVMGALFPIGLIIVVVCGAELFTGNCLMFVGLFDKKIGIGGLLKNWVIVYIGNLVGSVLIAYMMSVTGLWDTGGGMLGAIVVRTAIAKTSLSFGSAFVMGIMCNWLVCLAIWMATGASSMAGKAIPIWFCIMTFVMSGFEHSIANMYFIPAGMFAASNEAYVQLLSLDPSGLSVGSFFIGNLLPVTLGNIVGGGVFVGMLYWLIHRKLK